MSCQLGFSRLHELNNFYFSCVLIMLIGHFLCIESESPFMDKGDFEQAICREYVRATFTVAFIFHYSLVLRH